MLRTPPSSTRTYPPVPYTTLFRSGNACALDLGDGRHAFYEHLKPGSIRVVPGQRVRRGEVIAELGFTGDSTGPHLHFHVADAPSPLGAEGLRSEEHTSELQSLMRISYAVFCLKKKINKYTIT